MKIQGKPLDGRKPIFSFFDELPADSQKEILELKKAIMSDELSWSMTATFRFVKKELADKGIKIGASETTWRNWWKHEAGKEAGR